LDIDEQLGVVAALGGANLYDHGHGSNSGSGETFLSLKMKIAAPGAPALNSGGESRRRKRC
jgi:hypothetical protein